MITHAPTAPAPHVVTNDRIVRLALRKAGQLVCRHAFQIVQTRDRLFLRCPDCGAETVGFTIGPLRARRVS